MGRSILRAGHRFAEMHGRGAPGPRFCLLPTRSPDQLKTGSDCAERSRAWRDRRGAPVWPATASSFRVVATSTPSGACVFYGRSGRSRGRTRPGRQATYRRTVGVLTPLRPSQRDGCGRGQAQIPQVQELHCAPESLPSGRRAPGRAGQNEKRRAGHQRRGEQELDRLIRRSLDRDTGIAPRRHDQRPGHHSSHRHTSERGRRVGQLSLPAPGSPGATADHSKADRSPAKPSSGRSAL